MPIHLFLIHSTEKQECSSIRLLTSMVYISPSCASVMATPTVDHSLWTSWLAPHYWARHGWYDIIRHGCWACHGSPGSLERVRAAPTPIGMSWQAPKRWPRHGWHDTVRHGWHDTFGMSRHHDPPSPVAGAQTGIGIGTTYPFAPTLQERADDKHL